MTLSVVIPAHDERQVIGRLLARLLPDGPEPDIDVLVVCNGCTDGTADIASAVDGVRVLSTAVPGKANALRLGDDSARAFPRVYVDADVEIGRDDVLALCRVFEDPGVLAAGPRREIPRRDLSWPVRWYYDVWEQLPQVRTGLFGRGVIALSERGHDRIAWLPPMMADDLAISSAFDPGERRIVESALVVVHPPRTWADLMRRRVRAVTGTHQVHSGDVAPVSDSRTSRSDLLAVVRSRPSTLVKMPIFLLVALLARRRATAVVAAGDYSTWLRDESSRVGPSGSAAV